MAAAVSGYMLETGSNPGSSISKEVSNGTEQIDSAAVPSQVVACVCSYAAGKDVNGSSKKPFHHLPPPPAGMRYAAVTEVALLRNKRYCPLQRLSAKAAAAQRLLASTLKCQFTPPSLNQGSIQMLISSPEVELSPVASLPESDNDELPTPKTLSAETVPRVRGAGMSTKTSSPQPLSIPAGKANWGGNGWSWHPLKKRYVWRPFIYCPYFCTEGLHVYRNRHIRLYKALYNCTMRGVIHEGVQIVELLDPSHPVRFATPHSERAFSVCYMGESILSEHKERVIFGEYTGFVDDILPEDRHQYVFSLCFHKECFKFLKRDYIWTLPISLPENDTFAVDSSDEFNSMSMVNHYQCVAILNHAKKPINAEWQVVYVDAWPHIILTSIPGVAVHSGDELLADFGSKWFERVDIECNRWMRRKLLETHFADMALSPPSLYVDIVDDQRMTNDQLCGLCGGMDSAEDDVGVLCDGCNRAFHLQCINRISFQSHGDYEWFCCFCVMACERVCRAHLATSHPLDSHRRLAMLFLQHFSSLPLSDISHHLHPLLQHTFFQRKKRLQRWKSLKRVNSPSISLLRRRYMPFKEQQFPSSSTFLSSHKSKKIHRFSPSSSSFTLASYEPPLLSINAVVFPKIHAKRINSLWPLSSLGRMCITQDTVRGNVNPELVCGIISTTPALPESHMKILLPCKKCYRTYGADASGEICRIKKLHLEPNFCDPQNSYNSETPVDVIHSIIEALRSTVDAYRRRELLQETFSPSLSIKAEEGPSPSPLAVKLKKNIINKREEIYLKYPPTFSLGRIQHILQDTNGKLCLALLSMDGNVLQWMSSDGLLQRCFSAAQQEESSIISGEFLSKFLGIKI
ncbi:AP2 domain transcription factor AP2VIIa-7 [Cardiosporidium cionae]|uniref:AP2 domain transcription factor AP2VIIa-7 n=1 Tax=Cardiosporidium cionae TaxID=476202 RepID=A0ABQ7J8E5_9APIC|nr:AP2 domain transcription factor AP2VIIa-7 [Cardiosporidium cionae]|eukprot:KAF8819925.1 AP2 domain transcription factor AP2VIIa-7 [Cardiosporidium cionae]